MVAALKRFLTLRRRGSLALMAAAVPPLLVALGPAARRFGLISLDYVDAQTLDHIIALNFARPDEHQ